MKFSNAFGWMEFDDDYLSFWKDASQTFDAVIPPVMKKVGFAKLTKVVAGAYGVMPSQNNEGRVRLELVDQVIVTELKDPNNPISRGLLVGEIRGSLNAVLANGTKVQLMLKREDMDTARNFTENLRSVIQNRGRKVEVLNSSNLDVDSKTCPDCAEQVKAAARKCRYCGFQFE